MKSHIGEAGGSKDGIYYDMIHSYKVLNFINNARSLDSSYFRDISTEDGIQWTSRILIRILLICLHAGYIMLNLY